MSRRRICLALLALFSVLPVGPALAQVAPYFPERFDWQHRPPAQVGMDAALLDEALRYVVTVDNSAPRDQAQALAQSFGAKEPYFGGLLGATRPRAAINGLIVRRGYVVAEWGDTQRVDMTHSVAKTFLTTVVGLALKDGLIRDVNDKVAGSMPPGVDLFDAPHNQPITWDHLLRQTSDWQGSLWGKPDWADRPEGKPDDWATRKLHEPGTHYKYNDVRINVLALAALQVWRKPLPTVLRERVMDPIGASATWRWQGYDNSWVELDGQRMQSVSGGGHWGGGMFINAGDMARFGYLFLRGGQWKGQQIVAPEWIRQARTPGVANAGYGYANWFLNTDRKLLPAAPASSFMFLGNGQNVIYVDQQNDLLVVVRWIDNGPALNEFIGRVLAALKN